MKVQACRGLERSLIDDDASAWICRRKRQRDQRLLVVGAGLFIDEREDETTRWLDRTEGAADVEDIAIGRLHGDSVLRSLHRIELNPPNGKPSRAPPAPELLAIDERSEHALPGHD